MDWGRVTANVLAYPELIVVVLIVLWFPGAWLIERIVERRASRRRGSEDDRHRA